MELNCLEKHFKNIINEKYNDRTLTIGRVAHISKGNKPGARRVSCQYRNRCTRGCPYGAYFSSNSSTLPAAESTGNLSLRPNSIVSEVIFDNSKQKASGVRVIDTRTKKTIEFKSKIIYVPQQLPLQQFCYNLKVNVFHMEWEMIQVN